jgi:hypothetical protein
MTVPTNMQLFGINIDKASLLNFEKGLNIRSIITINQGAGGGTRTRRRRNYRQAKEDGEIIRLIAVLVFLYVGSLVYNFHYNRAEFWRQLALGAFVVAVFFYLVRWLIKAINTYRERRLNTLIHRLQKCGSEQEMKNFLSHYCKKFSRDKNAWKYQSFRIDSIHINNFIKRLASCDVVFNDTQISHLFQHYIDEREYELMTKNIAQGSN